MMESDHERDDREAREAMSVSMSSLGIAALRVQQGLLRILMAKGILSAEDAAVVYQYAADQCADNPQKPDLNRRAVAAAREVVLDLGEALLKESSQAKH
jgi:hypothetical protein